MPDRGRYKHCSLDTYIHFISTIHNTFFLCLSCFSLFDSPIVFLNIAGQIRCPRARRSAWCSILRDAFVHSRRSRASNETVITRQISDWCSVLRSRQQNDEASKAGAEGFEVCLHNGASRQTPHSCPFHHHLHCCSDKVVHFSQKTFAFISDSNVSSFWNPITCKIAAQS